MRRPHAPSLAGALSAVVAIALLAGAERVLAPHAADAPGVAADPGADPADGTQPATVGHAPDAGRERLAKDAAQTPDSMPMSSPEASALRGEDRAEEGRDEAAGPPVEGERWLLGAMLDRALSVPLPEAARMRLADLLIEARDLRAREAPGRAREILLALGAEFERIAGEPMGSVASRLALPGELAAEPPRTTRAPERP